MMAKFFRFTLNSPLQAPYKPLTSNKSLQKQNKTKKLLLQELSLKETKQKELLLQESSLKEAKP